MSGSPALSYSFSGKKVLVTGGGQGIGLELVSRLYKDNAKVFVIEKDSKLVENLRKEFPNVKAEVGDVSKWDETQKLIESFGPVDHLVNNAGIVFFEELLEITEDKFDKLIQVNLKGAFCVTQAVTKGMIAGGVQGSIVNLASLGSYLAARGIPVYCTTKAGIRMLTKATARELGKYGIRCNSVSPTAIDTPMFQTRKKVDPAENPAEVSIFARQPLAGKKALTTAEVADTILYLLSPLSSMANGTDVVLDGGILTC